MRRMMGTMALVAVFVLGAVGCGGDDDDPNGATSPGATLEGGAPANGSDAGDGEGSDGANSDGEGATATTVDRDAPPDPVVVEDAVTYLQQDVDVPADEAGCMAELLIRYFGNEPVREALAGGEEAIIALRESDPEADEAFIDALDQCWGESTTTP